MKKLYTETIAPRLQTDLGLANRHEVPALVKVSINMGTGKMHKDAKFGESAAMVLGLIAGQKPVARASKKSIASFKVREGAIVGYSVTLRGNRMYDFLTKLINVALPRIKDFRGIEEKLVDADGNLSLGLREHAPFAEVRPEVTDYNHGLQITIVTTARDHKEGLALFGALGFPIKHA